MDATPHPSNRPTEQNLETLFTYHPPSDDTIPKYARINEAAKEFAKVVLANTPGCADQTAAIRHVRDARMSANSAIALEPRQA